MKTKYYRFANEEEAIEVFKEAGLYDSEESFVTYAHNEGEPFGFLILGNTTKIVSTRTIASTRVSPEDGGVEFITKSEPREGYLINGIGAVPEKFIEYEIFPETPICKFAS